MLGCIYEKLTSKEMNPKQIVKEKLLKSENIDISRQENMKCKEETLL